jgi:hypothetical protein
MLSEADYSYALSQKQYFIENGTDATYMQWLLSKGTNFTCYLEYLNSIDGEQKLNNKIDEIRTIIYAIHRPIKFLFFYWTILIFILHKFNMKKPVMKIILFHFILRSLGDIIDKLGDLRPHYFSNSITRDTNGEILSIQCKYDVTSPEMHPFRWFLTRQIAVALWYCGEIVGDWYPLLRTRTLAKNQKSMWFVYISCGIFNLSKIALIFIHFIKLSPKDLYKKDGEYQKDTVDMFYFTYWYIQLIIIYACMIYEFAVYYVLRKNLSQITQKSGFIKKFKTVSQYRILVSAFISLTFLPIISITIIIKYYYYKVYNYHHLDFSFDEIRKSINNLQYYMIFIDQILLLHSKDETVYTSTSTLPSWSTSKSNPSTPKKFKRSL